MKHLNAKELTAIAGGVSPHNPDECTTEPVSEPPPEVIYPPCGAVDPMPLFPEMLH